MATAWSASIVKGAQDAVRGTASITTGKSIEIRADLDHFADGEAAFFLELRRLVDKITDGTAGGIGALK